MVRNEFADRGFTLIELLVVIAILMLLAGISISAHRVYKQNAYIAIAQSAVRSAKVALDAGRLDLVGDGGMGWIGTWTNSPGPVVSWTGDSFMPGYNNPKDLELMAFVSTWCEEADNVFCVVEGVMARHCRTGKFLSWHRWKNNLETFTEFDGMPTC